ncbi:acetyltransferase [Streptomyces sp. P38-E01]|uniref:Lysine N-acyltransferase MbtK n=1 Tax=Streptomyces tardus TaxID=2780544 RepID=A0A949JKC2_9ACTN|nr:GNAT family N-acetyltransferase [Streptomyces tardus]MBU7600300.1 acetyltransferase [Streptomyces tardus]
MTASDPAPAAELPPDPSEDDTLEVELPPELLAAHGESTADAQPAPRRAPLLADPTDLLDSVHSWPPTTLGEGAAFQLAPVRLERDLGLLTEWMNDPAVARYWELAGDEERVREHLAPQLSGDGRSVPCLGLLDGVPMSYWELYRADLDPLARSFPVQPHDTGVHLLVGPAERRGRGLGTALLRTVAALVLDHRPTCRRVLAEPDITNTPSVAAFLGAGFRFGAEAYLPGKRAAIMVHDRAHRDRL